MLPGGLESYEPLHESVEGRPTEDHQQADSVQMFRSLLDIVSASSTQNLAQLTTQAALSENDIIFDENDAELIDKIPNEGEKLISFVLAFAIVCESMFLIRRMYDVLVEALKLATSIDDINSLPTTLEPVLTRVRSHLPTAEIFSREVDIHIENKD